MYRPDPFTRQSLDQYKQQVRAKSGQRPEASSKKKYLTRQFFVSPPPKSLHRLSKSRPSASIASFSNELYATLSLSQKPSPRASIHTSGFNSVMLKSRSEASSSFGSYSTPTAPAAAPLKTKLSDCLPLESVLKAQRVLSEWKGDEGKNLSERYVEELRKLAKLVEEKLVEGQFPLS